MLVELLEGHDRIGDLLKRLFGIARFVGPELVDQIASRGRGPRRFLPNGIRQLGQTQQALLNLVEKLVQSVYFRQIRWVGHHHRRRRLLNQTTELVRTHGLGTLFMEPSARPRYRSVNPYRQSSQYSSACRGGGIIMIRENNRSLPDGQNPPAMSDKSDRLKQASGRFEPHYGLDEISPRVRRKGKG